MKKSSALKIIVVTVCPLPSISLVTGRMCQGWLPAKGEWMTKNLSPNTDVNPKQRRNSPMAVLT